MSPPRSPATGGTRAAWRERWYRIVFEHDTPAGRAFDVWLIVLILASVVVVMLESLSGLSPRLRPMLYAAEWVITLLFTAEYVLRLLTAPSARRYATSFLGVVDLLAVLPTYLSVLVPGTQALGVVRALRVLRIFRILKLTPYVAEAEQLGRALLASRRKILVFLTGVLSLVLIIGATMYLVEGPQGGFTSIPLSMYWAVVTLTTVGYGDLAPHTDLGRFLAAIVMILGYSIIAVPTGIVSVELSRAGRASVCDGCGLTAHDADARFCKRCGARLGGSPAHP